MLEHEALFSRHSVCGT